jgi:hypothetical protein
MILIKNYIIHIILEYVKIEIHVLNRQIDTVKVFK